MGSFRIDSQEQPTYAHTHKLGPQTHSGINPLLPVTHITNWLPSQSLSHSSNFTGCLVCAGSGLDIGEIPSYNQEL